MPRLLRQLAIFTALLLPMRQARGWGDCRRLWRWAGDGEWTNYAPLDLWEICIWNFRW